MNFLHTTQFKQKIDKFNISISEWMDQFLCVILSQLSYHWDDRSIFMSNSKTIQLIQIFIEFRSLFDTISITKMQSNDLTSNGNPVSFCLIKWFCLLKNEYTWILICYGIWIEYSKQVLCNSQSSHQIIWTWVRELMTQK